AVRSSPERYIVAGAFVVDIAGAMSRHRILPGALGPAGVGEQGVGAGGFSRNLGGPESSPCVTIRTGDRMRNPRPAVSALDRRERNDRRSARYRQAKATKRGERGAGRRSTP